MPSDQDSAASCPVWTVPVLRVVCWQLALLTALLAVFVQPWLGVLAGLLALSAVRVRGRWLTDVLATRTRYLLRVREHDVTPASLLTVLAPGAQVTTGAMLSGPDGVAVVLRPRGDAVPFLAALDEPGGIVLHASPGRHEPVRAWLTLRATRDADRCTDEELSAVLANATRRTLRRLSRKGIGAEALSEEDLTDTLVALTHTGSGRGSITEHWRHWQTGPVLQVCFRLHGTVTRGTLQRLLAAAPEVAITASPACLRVAAITLAAANAAATELTYLGERLGVRLERVDGAHGPAVAATLPIGGNPW